MKTLRTAWLTVLLATSAPVAMRYVDVNNAAPGSPITTWATAATNIQQAIDVAVAGDEIVVTNGVYASGGLVVPLAGPTTNRVAVTKRVVVRTSTAPKLPSSVDTRYLAQPTASARCVVPSSPTARC